MKVYILWIKNHDDCSIISGIYSTRKKAEKEQIYKLESYKDRNPFWIEEIEVK